MTTAQLTTATTISASIEALRKIAPASHWADASAPNSAASHRRDHRTSGRAPSPQRKLHGSYIGYLRQIREGKRGPYKRLQKEEGYEAAIKKLREDLRK